MFPLTDHIRRQTFWLSTLALLIGNFLAFFHEISLGAELNEFVLAFGIVPARYTNPALLASTNLEGLLVPLFTAMFLHGGWLHLLGNMLFLFVFGRSVEDFFGHLRFLFLYLLGGLAGSLVHIVLGPGSTVPTIGASGAVAAVLGAYFVRFPRARITTVVPILFFFWTVRLPAVLILGYWFLLQFLTGYQALAIESATGGVAWWAHVGGFLAGILLALLLRPRRRRPVVEVIS